MSISKKRLKELNNIRDENIDVSDIPELPKEFWRKAEIVFPQQKQPVSLRIDSDILNWFKHRGKGYQSKINAVLRSYVKAHND
jgi:uncharacterized protein (DUF4415 family)